MTDSFPDREPDCAPDRTSDGTWPGPFGPEGMTQFAEVDEVRLTRRAPGSPTPYWELHGEEHGAAHQAAYPEEGYQAQMINEGRRMAALLHEITDCPELVLDPVDTSLHPGDQARLFHDAISCILAAGRQAGFDPSWLAEKGAFDEQGSYEDAVASMREREIKAGVRPAD